jgi:hypothetical protein
VPIVHRGFSDKNADLISMLRCAKANCKSKGQTWGRVVVEVHLFRRNRRQRACWWWARARREVLRCHVGLVVDEGGHCLVVGGEAR